MTKSIPLNRLSMSAYFRALGAPLNNYRWSWGARRIPSGEVILRVWTDKVIERNGRQYVELADVASFKNSKHLGYRERLAHIEMLRNGAKGYLIFCSAQDPKVMPRKIVSFDSQRVFPTTDLIDIRGDAWIGFADPIPSCSLMNTENGG